MTHYWWKKRGFDEKDYGQFYQWLRGDTKSLPFSKIIDDTFHDLELPSTILTKDEFKSIYSQLCSYAHKPIKDESLTSIRGTNISEPSTIQCIYWMRLTYVAISSLLYVMIGRDPICLFPVPQYRKFGFNPPVGWFFDDYNYIPLVRALTNKRVEELRVHYKDRDPPKSSLDWFYEQPDLDNDAILATWNDQKDPIEDDGKRFDDKMLLRIALIKAKMRVIHYGFSYGDEGPEITDFRKIISRFCSDSN